VSSPYGPVQPVPQNAPSSAEYVVGVQPGISNALVAANVVIVYGAGGGIFLYNGTPTAGNLIAAITATSGTDSFGNAYTSVLEVGMFTARHLLVDGDGDILIYNNANVNVARWSTGDGSLRLYNTSGAGTGNLVAALSPADGTDTFGNTYSVGLTVGDEGSTYAIIDNEGNLTISGTVTASGDVDVSGDMDVSGDLVISGNIETTGTTLQINSTDVYFTNDIIASGNIFCDKTVSTDVITATAASSSIAGASFPCAHVSNASGPSGDSQAAYNAAIYNTIVSLKAAGIMEGP
jgi:hypothetical protein